MKIVVVAGLGSAAKEIAGYCASALQEMGNAVAVRSYDLGPRERLIPSFLLPPLRSFGMKRFGTDLAADRPDVVLVVKGEELQLQQLEALRDQVSATWINWWIDDPALLHASRGLSPSYDLFLTSDPGSVAAHRQAGCRKVESLSFGFDPAVHQPGGGPRRWDLVFAGRLTPRRAEWLAPLVPAGLGLWTDRRMGWVSADARILAQELPPSHPLRKAWRGDPVHGRELAQLYGETKICVNLHAQKGEGTNRRVFEATACGALLLTEDRPLLRELFTVGGSQAEIATFSSQAELLEKARYYLAHEDERKAIASRGLARARRDHSYALRMKRVLEMLP